MKIRDRSIILQNWASRLGFFKSGLRTASLNRSGKCPSAKEAFTRAVIVFINSVMQFLSNHVGIGSSSHVFVGLFMIILNISSSVAGSK